jgi:hypothetical protein
MVGQLPRAPERKGSGFRSERAASVLTCYQSVEYPYSMMVKCSSTAIPSSLPASFNRCVTSLSSGEGVATRVIVGDDNRSGINA